VTRDDRLSSTGKPYAEISAGDLSVLTELQSEWEDLLGDTIRNEPFLHPAWFRAYASAFEAGKQIAALTVRRAGTLTGVIPLVRDTRCFGTLPARTLRSLSGKHSCRFDCIVSKQDHSATIEAAWQSLRADISWDVLEALDVPDGGAFEDLSAQAAKDGYLVSKWPTLLSPYLPVSESPADPFIQSPNRYRKARARLQSSLRRLATNGDVAFKCDSSDCRSALHRFVTMEMAGWKGVRGSAIGCSKQAMTFYSQVVEEFAKTGSLRIYTLWLNQTPVAMELGLVVDRTYFAPKATYDEQFASFSPGHLLTRHVISDLAEHGISRYDFLGPRARHKTLWAGEVLPHAHYLIFSPTFLGQLRHIAVDKVAPLLRNAKRRFVPDPQDQ
jgi:CelD/BcsL family acetyltransferase involved in cellulose biosynthesis